MIIYKLLNFIFLLNSCNSLNFLMKLSLDKEQLSKDKEQLSKDKEQLSTDKEHLSTYKENLSGILVKENKMSLLKENKMDLSFDRKIFYMENEKENIMNLLINKETDNRLNNELKITNNNNDIITNNYLYIISHHYQCDDYFYQPYCDLYRIYKTYKEAFQEIYNMYDNELYKDYHFKVVKYRINKINEDQQISYILYDSYKHLINEKLEVINKEIEQEEDFLQVRRLYHWA